MFVDVEVVSVDVVVSAVDVTVDVVRVLSSPSIVPDFVVDEISIGICVVLIVVVTELEDVSLVVTDVVTSVVVLVDVVPSVVVSAEVVKL